jgi:hypothetical protein
MHGLVHKQATRHRGYGKELKLLYALYAEAHSAGDYGGNNGRVSWRGIIRQLGIRIDSSRSHWSPI